MARFGAGRLAELPAVVAALDPGGVVVVADANAARHHDVPIDAPRVTLAGGEAAKEVGGWSRLLDAFVEHGLDRSGVVVAFGGGATLDVAGFAAAAYLRGVRWIALPTTLLAQVDAAHGGKTGIDHAAAKNLVGAFHPPAEVLVDPDLLATLPEREIAGGLAEVIKHAVIGAPGLLERAGREPPAGFVEEAARVKLGIVERDPLETGERRLLNLGHTLGHALERASGYALTHGEAVALGLRAAVRLAAKHCAFGDGAAVEAALDRCGLPARVDLDEGAVFDALRHDKKRVGARLRWVLPVALGDVRVFEDVAEADVRAVFATLR